MTDVSLGTLYINKQGLAYQLHYMYDSSNKWLGFYWQSDTQVINSHLGGWLPTWVTTKPAGAWNEPPCQPVQDQNGNIILPCLTPNTATLDRSTGNPTSGLFIPDGPFVGTPQPAQASPPSNPITPLSSPPPIVTPTPPPVTLPSVTVVTNQKDIYAAIAALFSSLSEASS